MPHKLLEYIKNKVGYKDGIISDILESITAKLKEKNVIF